MGELEHILETLESSLGPITGEPVPLEGGITNRNFRATLGGEEYMIRRHGKDTNLLGIDRAAERLASEEAARLGIAPELVVALDQGLVTRFISCEALAPEEMLARVPELAAALRRFHDSAITLPVSFSVPDLLAEYARLTEQRGGELPAEYAETSEIARRISAALPEAERRPCHNDLLPGNIIRARENGAIMIVDWEYAGIGHPYFDLGNLSVNNGFTRDADERLLSAYHGEPPTRERRAALALMRILSDAREAAWGVVQGHVSELDFDFAGYAREHFERLLAAAAGADFEEWLAAA